MNLLVDTHLVLWAMQGRAVLPKAALRWLDDADRVFVSAASVWEVVIRSALGKLRIDVARLEERLGDAGFEPLPVRPAPRRRSRRCRRITGIPSTGCWSRRRSASRCAC